MFLLFLKLFICGTEAAAQTEGGPYATDRRYVVGGCAKVSQLFLVVVLLLFGSKLKKRRERSVKHRLHETGGKSDGKSTFFYSELVIPGL